MWIMNVKKKMYNYKIYGYEIKKYEVSSKGAIDWTAPAVSHQ
jgi:hypothetical protein